MTPRTTRVVAAAAAQLVLVGVAVWAPLSARLTGEEVRLRVAAVDPVDPGRGAYVDLSYPDLPGSSGTGDSVPVGEDERGTAYVPLTRQGAVWVGGEVLRRAPTGGTYLRCDDSGWRLRCGIESLWLPQDEAAAVTSAVQAGTAVATVRVDARGNAALVGVATG
ncbi:GDYXXLXY domain-containing protein [Phycicoccus sonneratiae]|uniref:GDYXXLXY domain-containing protein n=1 Tax=Phycicoccus sonneratiae TaxID=2807628 RepID=A0ABS2CMK6_9MICO|nr:GDYXXLXY domain-containing protein [Phycicoccus sonneraticus]MBM6401040.1 GDYXXLXY domain-containing protein [Phycicoccus sonneraticus]